MNLIKPKNLNKGDTIAIIAPSGEVNIEKIKSAVQYFENKGYKVKLGANLSKCRNYLAGNDNERAEDLNNAFADKDVNAIVCARGGYGAIRLIDKIDFDIIKNNPKIFCGYSDITALSAMILKKTGLITYSGPMAQSDFSDNDINSFTEEKFFETLSPDLLEIEPENLKIYHTGEAEGILFGGNLATNASLCGLDFIPDEKFIFFAEDICEPVYKIDRYFTQLLNIEKFKNNLTGIVLGDFLETDNKIWLEEFFQKVSKKLDIPVYGGYPISHDKRKTTIPVGVQAKISNNGVISLKY